MRRRQILVAAIGATATPVGSAVGVRAGRPDPERVLLELVEYAIDGDDPDDEYVRIANAGEEPLDMSGWRVEDDGLVPAETLDPFVFPTGFTLAPDAEVTLFTGDGEPTDETLYWGVDRQIWSEDGDVLVVRDEDGTVMFERPFAGEESQVIVEITRSNDPVEAGHWFEQGRPSAIAPTSR